MNPESPRSGRDDAPGFFLFDGSLLLLSLSTGDDGKKPADKQDLDEKGFQAFIPQHALTLGQDSSLAVMLLPLEETLWLQPALDRLKTETGERACKAVQDPISDEALGDLDQQDPDPQPRALRRSAARARGRAH